MRPGYLAALASRTLGVAPVLKPPTPSRFEPERLGAESSQAERLGAESSQAERLGAQSPRVGWREAAETQEAMPDPSAAPWRAPAVAAAGEPGPGPALQASRPLRGFFGPDLGQGRLAVRADRENRSARDAQEAPVSQPAADPAEPADRLRAMPSAASRIPGQVPPGSTAALRAGRGASAPEADLAEASGHRAVWPEEGRQPLPSGSRAPAAGPTGPSRQQTRAAGEPSGGPVIVVRIGRVDVRAVRAAPPAGPAPPPKPPAGAAGPAGSSLAEYLRARDRGRR